MRLPGWLSTPGRSRPEGAALPAFPLVVPAPEIADQAEAAGKDTDESSPCGVTAVVDEGGIQQPASCDEIPDPMTAHEAQDSTAGDMLA